MENSLCLQCGNEINGASQKKFCDDKCRKAYSRRELGQEEVGQTENSDIELGQPDSEQEVLPPQPVFIPARYLNYKRTGCTNPDNDADYLREMFEIENPVPLTPEQISAIKTYVADKKNYRGLPKLED